MQQLMTTVKRFVQLKLASDQQVHNNCRPPSVAASAAYLSLSGRMSYCHGEASVRLSVFGQHFT